MATLQEDEYGVVQVLVDDVLAHAVAVVLDTEADQVERQRQLVGGVVGV